jgi:branched-chain amino acid transport system substrate-binding protein
MHSLRKRALAGLLVLVAIVIGVSASACGTGDTSTSESTAPAGPVKIGYIVSQTGFSAVVGKSFLAGTQYAVDQINASGGIDGRQIELIVKDDGSDVAKAVAATNQLIQQEKVDLIIGPCNNLNAPAARAVAEKAQMPMILPISNDPGDTTAYKWSFTSIQGPDVNGASIVTILQEHGWKNAVLVGDILPVNQQTLDSVEQLAPAAGIETTRLKDTWQLDATDFTGVATKIKAACNKAGADSLVLGSYSVQFPGLMGALQTVGFDLPVIGNPSAAQPFPLFAQGPDPVQGLIFPGFGVTNAQALPDSYAGKQQLMDFVDGFTTATKMPPDMFVSAGYDPVLLVQNAVTNAGSTDKTAVRDALESTSGFQGLNGTFTYSPTVHAQPVDGYWEWTVKGKGFEIGRDGEEFPPAQ